MAERTGSGKLTPTEQARECLMMGAVSFAQTNSVDLKAILEKPTPKNVVIDFRYGSESRLGVFPEVTEFLQTVYARTVDLRLIRAMWYFQGGLSSENPAGHRNFIDLFVELPADTDKGAILIPKRECYRYPTLRIDVDNTPFIYAVREQSVVDQIRGGLSFNIALDNTQPRVIMAVGEMLAGPKEQSLPKRGLRGRVRSIVVRNLFPELYTPLKPPFRSISVEDPEEVGHLL